MKACFWRQIRWLRKMQMLAKEAQAVWREEGKYADPEFAVITEKLGVDLASKLARREAVAQSAEERAKAKLERERFRSTT